MKRLQIIVPSLFALAIGWTWGAYGGSTADAGPARRSCRAELADARQEVARLEVALEARDRQVALILEKERERVRMLEAKIGQMMRGSLPDDQSRTPQ